MSDVLVLCYHAVSERWTAPLSVRPEALEEQLQALVHRGYRGATFTEALTSPPAQRTLAVTFDDAFASVAQLALPILSRLNLPATVFVPTDFPDRRGRLAWPGIDHWLAGPDEHELVPLSWAGLRELADRGWEVGSHTCSHPHLTTLSDGELERELADSRRMCEERLGRPCSTIAYPYGDVDDRVAAAARSAGYRTGAALPAGPLRPDPMQWPRVGIYHPDRGWRFVLKTAPPVRRARAGPLAARAVSVVRALSARARRRRPER